MFFSRIERNSTCGGLSPFRARDNIMYYKKPIAANPRKSIFEKCLKSCFDRLER